MSDDAEEVETVRFRWLNGEEVGSAVSTLGLHARVEGAGDRRQGIEGEYP